MPFDQPQLGQLAVDRAAGEGGREGVVAQVPDEHPAELGIARVDGDVVGEQA